MRLATLLPTAFASLACLSAAHAQAPASEARVMEGAAAAYADYQGHVSSIRAKPLADAEQLDKELTTFGASNPDQLSSGWISYQAMIAAQNKDFSGAVRDIEAYYGRDRVMTGMRNDVGYARTLKGGETALQSALLANGQDTSRINSAADYVKQQAYKLQDVAWGKTKLKDPSGRAGELKVNAKVVKPIAEAATKLFAGPDLGAMLASASASGGQSSIWDKVSTLTASAPTSALAAVAPSLTTTSLNPAPALGPTKTMKVDPRREGTANRIVTLAAFHVLNAESSHTDDVKVAMKDRPTSDCIDWSQLQLQACVSAAYTRADLSFCLAEHAIRDPGACFANVAR